ncbi:MAG TPA: SDR family oxidoreductase [Nitrososphaeraceae archaeon]|nr:SDR family oxidoreductase [Nitrososphaeraceae archaeon]
MIYYQCKRTSFYCAKSIVHFTGWQFDHFECSIGSSKGGEELSVYSATKVAVRSFARTWTVDLKYRKIRVNAISPGSIDTPILNPVLNEEQVKQFKKNVTKSIPMGRMGSPDEVAKAVLFLASDDSSYVTGIELFVDGGVAQI